MLEKIRPALTALTMVGLLAGLLFGLLLQGRTWRKPVKELDFVQEIERGSHMPLIITSPELTAYANDPKKIDDAVAKSESLVLSTMNRANLLIPDPYAASFFGCSDAQNGAWFTGRVDSKSEIFGTSQADAEADKDGHLGARFRAIGSVYRCEGDRKIRVATGVSVSAPIHPSSAVAVQKLTSWASYTGFVANLYLTFLLMLFLPTLAISLVKAILDSAESSTKFRYIFVYFVGSSLIGGFVGGIATLILRKLVPTIAPNSLTPLATSLGGGALVSDYDPHPVLTQLGRIIPNNPFGALTDPSGNSGLQVAFIGVILGMALVTLSPPARKRASAALKKALAFVISDRDLKFRALSDYAEYVAPLGVLFLAMTTFSSIDFSLLRGLAGLTIVLLLALAVHMLIILVWLNFFRNPQSWIKGALIPGFGGLITAFATASSYAALPALAAVPVLSEDPSKRSILDLGTTLNKNGTAVYLAAAATFISLQYGAVSWYSVISIALLAAAAGIVVAGLPFAAIFGLRMILVSLGVPGGLAWLILPVDPVADRFVTVVNVFSNLAACSDRKGKITLVQPNATEEAQAARERIPVQSETRVEQAAGASAEGKHAG